MTAAHLDDELLAGLALGIDAPSPDQQRHLDGCPECRTNEAELRRLTEQATEAGHQELPAPDPALLSGIRAELAGDGLSPTSERPEHDRRRTPRWRSRVAVAAALGLLAGAGGVLGVERFQRGQEEVLARTTLAALPGQVGSGTAQLVRHDGRDLLQVSVSSADPPETFRELWLLTSDGQRMMSLGVLDSSGQGRYPLPASLSPDLHGYTLVDVSLEPLDGDAAHSSDSIVRGQLG